MNRRNFIKMVGISTLLGCTTGTQEDYLYLQESAKKNEIVFPHPDDYKELSELFAQTLDQTILNIANRMRKTISHARTDTRLDEPFTITGWLNSNQIYINGCHSCTKLWERIGEVIGMEVEEVSVYVPEGRHSGTYFPELDWVMFHSDNWFCHVPEHPGINSIPIRRTIMSYSDFKFKFLDKSPEEAQKQMGIEQSRWNFSYDIPYSVISNYILSWSYPDFVDINELIEINPDLSKDEIISKLMRDINHIMIQNNLSDYTEARFWVNNRIMEAYNEEI